MTRDLIFPSLTALVEHVKTLPDADSRNYDYDTSPERMHWAGGTFNQAYELATHGWPEGAVQSAEISTKLANRVVGRTSLGLVHTVSYDVIGAAYDAGAVALGIPEAWGVLQPEVTKRAVRIVVNPATSGAITPREICARGVAVAALVLVLQTNGYPVTLDVFAGAKERTNNVLVRVIDASTGSIVDLDRIVYATAHASMDRRLIRAAQSDYRMGRSGDKWGSGRPTTDAAPPGEIDLYIGGTGYWQYERWQDGGEAWVIAEYERQTKGGV